MIAFIKKYKRILLLLCLLLALTYWKSLGDELFHDPLSTVLVDRDNNLLGAKIAADEQWRFPPNDSVPELFEKAIVCFEDKRFYSHPGFDVFALARAIKLNWDKGAVKSGGSTLSMQVIRLSRKGKARTVFEKIIELILATRLELEYSKEEILAFYAANAPFGGNIVGLDAAAWKYYERPAHLLSLGEAATLAVLPNAPSLIHPNKNRDALRAKRNRLLNRMYEQELIDSLSWILAKEEPLPQRAKPLPSVAPHLLQRVIDEKNKDQKAVIASTLSIYLQKEVNRIARIHHERLKQNGIFNLAAIVAEVESGEVVAYVGNTPNRNQEHGFQVDILQSRRSSGSVFKPFLYADMISHGALLPEQLVPDIPSNFSGFTPKNFDYRYSGAVPADEALYRSLNVPASRQLSEFGIHQFHTTLKNVGFTTLNRSSTHYGLSLVLGGAECSLWDLAGSYAGMARSILPRDSEEDFRYTPLQLYRGGKKAQTNIKQSQDYPLDRVAVWHTLQALTAVKRPRAESYWRSFSSSGKVAWKTGTSYGNRDAWSVGCTPEYVVAVWCGNADGEGRPELVGVRAAAPFMFDIFNLLGTTENWFEPAYDDLYLIETCAQSGFKVGQYCTERDSLYTIDLAERSKVCPYHRQILVDPSKEWRVHDACESPQNMEAVNLFILPPLMEKFYKSRNPSYEGIPPYRGDCLSNLPEGIALKNLELVYPKANTSISIPIELDESKGKVVFEASHRNKDAIIYWHLDEEYIGQTSHFHEFGLNPAVGDHTITLVDDLGETVSAKFSVHE